MIFQHVDIKKGAIVVLTGELQQADRIETMNILESAGCIVTGSVSKKTSFLIIGEGALQKKIDRAKELGIPIISEEEFWKNIEEQFPSAETAELSNTAILY